MDPQIIILLILTPILFSAGYAGLSAAPWLPTKPKQRKLIIKAAQIKGNETICDLGSGDGSMLFAIARHHPNAKLIGYEISVLPYLVSILRKYLRPRAYRNVSLRFGDLFRQDLSGADIVFVFLLAKSYPRLAKKFEEDLKPDAIIVVEAWAMPNFEPEQKLKEENLLPVYRYLGKQFLS
jgi:precorrin-6B methylase 2